MANGARRTMSSTSATASTTSAGRASGTTPSTSSSPMRGTWCSGILTCFWTTRLRTMSKSTRACGGFGTRRRRVTLSFRTSSSAHVSTTTSATTTPKSSRRTRRSGTSCRGSSRTGSSTATRSSWRTTTSTSSTCCRCTRGTVPKSAWLGARPSARLAAVPTGGAGVRWLWRIVNWADV